MADKPATPNIGLIFTSTIIFIISMVMIGYQFQLQLLDVLTIVLAIVSLLIAGYQKFIASSSNRLLDMTQVIIAAILALRFGLPLLLDFSSLPTLLLFGAIILFFYIAISGAISLFAGGLPAFPAMAKPKEAENASDENTESVVTEEAATPGIDAENPDVSEDANEPTDDATEAEAEKTEDEKKS